MVPVQKEKIKKMVREIELLLGPSFSVTVFARALSHELKLSGIKSQVVQAEIPSCTILIADNFELLIRGEDTSFMPETLTPVQGLWIPHKLLLFPTSRPVQLSY